jgi:RNA polymerase sigma factor (TIGR02999 family)
METSDGPRAPLDQLVPELYGELRRIAGRAMRGQPAGHTLQPTALVHEAYLRLAGARRLEVGDRPKLLALAARVMRQILVDHARARRTDKRGGDEVRVTLSPAIEAPGGSAYELVSLDEALSRLEAIDGRQVRIVELRYVAGLSVDEVADVLGLSTATIKHESAMARAWLYAELSGEAP